MKLTIINECYEFVELEEWVMDSIVYDTMTKLNISEKEAISTLKDKEFNYTAAIEYELKGFDEDIANRRKVY